MKKVLKHQEPSLLKAYREAHPNESWKRGFRSNNRNGYEQLKERLRKDQKNLCAYCEIDLIRGGGMGLDDFRVEHFYPENPPQLSPSPSSQNPALDWGNMLGCCLGGNTRGVTGSSHRFTSPDHSCDVPKGNRILTGTILNPITDIPAFPRLFKFSEQGSQAGEIGVDETLCPPALQTQAQNSIDELRLNAKRLIRFRKSVLDKLREQLNASIESGIDDDEAMEDLCETYFPDSPEKDWPAFFTTIRWYLADKAEERLRHISFEG